VAPSVESISNNRGHSALPKKASPKIGDIAFGGPSKRRRQHRQRRRLRCLLLIVGPAFGEKNRPRFSET